MKNLFVKILQNNRFNFDKCYFSWIKDVYINNNKNNSDKYNSVKILWHFKMKRKSSPQTRLYQKLKNFFEKKK